MFRYKKFLAEMWFKNFKYNMKIRIANFNLMWTLRTEITSFRGYSYN